MGIIKVAERILFFEENANISKVAARLDDAVVVHSCMVHDVNLATEYKV